MATVIPLVQPGQVAQEGSHPVDTMISTPQTPVADSLERAVGLLQRLAGADAGDLPSTLGQVAARAEWLLAEGPTALDTATSEPAQALDRASHVVAASRSLLDLILEEVEVLSEAISAQLTSASLGSIHDIADAILDLATVSRAAPHWGDPNAADAAELVLGVLAEDLREAAQAHEALYQRFTESIWQVPTPLLRAGRHRWRLIARARLRRQLRAASRSDRVGKIAAAAKDVLEVRAIRDRVDALAPLLAHHLGALDCGPLSDIDGALVPLKAVRRLQGALGDRVEGARMQQMLLADAFRTHDVTGPALRVRNAIRAWQSDLARADASDASWIHLDELNDWVIECASTVPALAEGLDAATGLGLSVESVRALVDVLVLREHVERLIEAEGASVADISESAS
ncbi:MAG: hypothetical protein ACOYXM_08155 [Actinomycetota bacterium]